MDEFAVPPGEELLYPEAIVRLPHGRFCYAPPDYAPEPMDPPSLKRSHVTFGSFNHVAKIGDGVVRLWADILKANPSSRLILKWKTFDEPEVRARLCAAFSAHGVEADRLELRGFSPHRAMLEQYGEIDVALDPFPFGGGLTSCEALWMGVPVVTLPGDRPASRQTAGFPRQYRSSRMPRVLAFRLCRAGDGDGVESAASRRAQAYPARPYGGFLALRRSAFRPRVGGRVPGHVAPLALRRPAGGLFDVTDEAASPPLPASSRGEGG